MSSTQTRKPRRACHLAVCMTGALLAAAMATAADRSPATDEQTQYRNDRAACLNSQSNQDRATCLKEAGAALQEARRGHLDNGRDGESQFGKNRVLRCDGQPAQDRADCLRRMNGEGVTRGSVESGGIIRELVTTEPAQK